MGENPQVGRHRNTRLDDLISSFHMKIGGVDIPNFQPRIQVQFLKEAFRRWKKFHFVKDHQSVEGLAGVKPTQGAASKHPTRTSKPSDHGLLEGWASLLCAVLSSLGDGTFHRHSDPRKNSRNTAGKNFPKISKVLQQQASHLQPFWNPGRSKDQSSHSSASVPLASSRVGCSRAVRFSRSSFHKTREADLFRSERNPQPVNRSDYRYTPC